MTQIIDRIRGKFSKDDKTKGSVKTDFINFLNSYNCKYNIEDERDEKLVRIYFDYQGGHFIAVLKDNNMGVDVNYPSFTDAPYDELQLVRAMCNRFNNNSSVLKYSYTFDEAKNLLRVHISFFCTSIFADDMTDLLNACFYFQRSFCDEYHDARNNQESYETRDIERTFARNSRERFLIAQQELRHQSDDPRNEKRCSFEGGLTMSDFIKTVMGIDAHVCQSMIVIQDTTTCTVAAHDIDSWQMSKLLIDGQGIDAKFAHTQAAAMLRINGISKKDKSGDFSEQLLTISALPDGSDDTSLYFRITAILTPLTTSRNAALNSRGETFTPTLLVAYDKTSPKQKQQEFDYMWQDALIKIRDGEELSDEQQLIVDVTDANIGYCIYWGKHHMLNDRYTEAVILFENAYNAMSKVFFKLSDEMKDTYREVCYNIGFCYTELHQNEKAFYYLHMLEEDGNIRHNSELINCLANNRDIRVFRIINDIMDAINKHADQEGNIPEELQTFVNFLRRRRAYSLIDFDELDEAEKAFTEMLDEPDNSDFALGELAYIKQLRKARGEDTTDNPTTDSTDSASGSGDGKSEE